jgi:uncharacterized protein YjbJ (UPF0337 family)
MSDPIKTAHSEGTFEEIGGTIKKKIGHILGDEKMELEGRAKELGGQARKAAADASEHAKGVVQEAVGAVENRVGHLIDNKDMQAKGRSKELAGQVHQKHSS